MIASLGLSAGLDWIKSSNSPASEGHLVVENVGLRLQKLSHTGFLGPPASWLHGSPEGPQPRVYHVLARSFTPIKPCYLAYNFLGVDLTILRNLIPALPRILCLRKAVSSTGPGVAAGLLKLSGNFPGNPPP